MILTDDEIRQVWQTFEANSGLDAELLRRCGHLIRIGAFDEAVRNAFVLLEERLRKAVNKDGMTGTSLASHAFNSTDGPLAKQLGHNVSEREGLRELYSGAFKLFRNPTAHGVVGYDSIEGKSIIGLVNLLLTILNRVSELPPPNLFPENLEKVLIEIEKTTGASVVSRLRMFAGRCIKAGIESRSSTKQWIPFRRHALVKYDHWEKQKPSAVTVFYIFSEDKSKGIWFPINQYYRSIIAFDSESIQKELRGIGFQQRGRLNDYSVDLQIHNDKEFFDGLLHLVLRIAKEFEATLSLE